MADKEAFCSSCGFREYFPHGRKTRKCPHCNNTIHRNDQTRPVIRYKGMP